MTWLYERGVTNRIYSNTFLNKHSLLLDLWKDLAEMNPKQRGSFGKVPFGEIMGERIIWDLITNIFLPDSMVRRTKIWHYQNVYVHVIIYVSFYINPWYLNYNWTQARWQAPRPRGRRKTWLTLKGPPFYCVFKLFSKSEERPQWRMNMTHFLPKSYKEEMTVTD